MEKLIELQGVAKSFGAGRQVLAGVDFSLREGEIVALLGKSGSGKSTLLRIIAGLIAADAGSARYHGHDIAGPAAGVAMVFQSFALFPWLTVQQNVELGLEAQGVAPDERARRADAMLDLIGLSGFGGALPRELSGGMRQRVGIARALALNPDVLLLDEAFSALDVLTGETLRKDILELWDSRQLATKAMLVVSHNIEEAVMMADRIVLMSSNPGKIRIEVPITLARPRNPDSPEVRALIDHVYALMTQRPALADPRLPDTDVNRIEAVLELLAGAPFHGLADLPQLSEEAELPDEELFPTYEALGLLGLAIMESGDIALTALGRRYVAAGQAQRQEIFGRQLLAKVPLAARIRQMLATEAGGAMPERRLLEMLEGQQDAAEARRTLEVAIEWGRYGEVYEYDFNTGRLQATPAP